MIGVYILMGFFAGVTAECWLEKLRRDRNAREIRESATKMAETMKTVMNTVADAEGTTEDKQDDQ